LSRKEKRVLLSGEAGVYFKDYWRAYAGQSIGMDQGWPKKIPAYVTVEGRPYLVTGALYKGSAQPRMVVCYVDLQPLHTRKELKPYTKKQWLTKAFHNRDKTQRGYYYGMLVTCRGKQFVVGSESKGLIVAIRRESLRRFEQRLEEEKAMKFGKAKKKKTKKSKKRGAAVRRGKKKPTKKKKKKGAKRKTKKAWTPKRIASKVLLGRLNKAIDRKVDAAFVKSVTDSSRTPSDSKMEKVEEFMHKVAAPFVKRLETIIG